MRVLVLFLFLSLAISGQRIQSFNVFENNGTVVLKFAVKPGPSCFGFTVLHSADSITYAEIGSDPAICGISTISEPKEFTHFTPVKNVLNYYKVRLEPSVETSNERKIFVDDIDGKVKLSAYPNPFYLDDVVTLKLFNVNNVALHGFLHNNYGKQIQTLNVTPSQNRATFSVSGLDNGAYSVWLTDGAQTFTCKLIILR